PRSTKPHSYQFTTPPPPTTSTLSLHDALPISRRHGGTGGGPVLGGAPGGRGPGLGGGGPWHGPGVRADHGHGAAGGARHRQAGTDRKSTRLNSSHVAISYAVFCLKKKKNKI